MEEKSQNEEGQQFQIDINPVVAGGVYSNLQIIFHSSSEFVLDFATLLPGLSKATVASRVLIAPEHAKRLIRTLQENVVRYEQEFGKINLPEANIDDPRTIAPFGKGPKS